MFKFFSYSDLIISVLNFVQQATDDIFDFDDYLGIIRSWQIGESVHFILLTIRNLKERNIVILIDIQMIH